MEAVLSYLPDDIRSCGGLRSRLVERSSGVLPSVLAR